MYPNFYPWSFFTFCTLMKTMKMMSHPLAYLNWRLYYCDARGSMTCTFYLKNNEAKREKDNQKVKQKIQKKTHTHKTGGLLTSHGLHALCMKIYIGLSTVCIFFYFWHFVWCSVICRLFSTRMVYSLGNLWTRFNTLLPKPAINDCYVKRRLVLRFSCLFKSMSWSP